MIPESVLGTLQVLNVGTGDTKFIFDPAKPAECERAKKVVTEMLRSGYVLFVELPDGKLRRVKRFNSTQGTYIIEEAEADAQGTQKSVAAETAPGGAASREFPAKRKPGRPRSVDAGKVRTVGVARTAGG